MAEVKSVLLELNVDISKGVDQLARYEVEVERLTEEIGKYQAKQKSGEKLSASERSELIRLTEQRKALKKEMSDQSRQIQNAIVAEGKYKDTLKGLCAELSTAKDRLRAMKLSGEENTKAYAEQSEYVGRLNDQIKEMEAAYGVYTRNVGNYEMAVHSSKEEVASLVQQLAQLTAAQKTNSAEYQEAKAKLDEYSLSLQDNNKSSLEFANGGVTAVIGALSIMAQTMDQDTEEGRKMAELMTKLQIATTALSALMAAYQAIEQKGLIQKIATNVQVKAGALALRMQAKAQAAATGATVAGTVAQKALNKAMMANPILLIVAAVAALVTGLIALVSWLLKSTDAQRAAEKAQKDYEKQTRKTESALAFLEAKEAERATKTSKRYQDEIAEMMRKGATQEEIDRKTAEMEEALADISTETSRERIDENNKQLAVAEKNWKAQKALLDEMRRRKGEDHKKTLEQEQVEAEAYQNYLSVVNAVYDDIRAVNDATFEHLQKQYEKDAEAFEKAYERKSKKLEMLDSLYREYSGRYDMYIYDTSKTEAENEEERYMAEVRAQTRSFEYEQKLQKQKLSLDRQYRKITQSEYEAQLQLLDEQSKTFYLQQAEDLAAHTRELLKNAIDLAGGKSVEARIGDIREAYRSAAEQIKADATLTAEEKSYYVTQLAMREAEEIRNIRISATEDANSRIEALVSDMYRDDVRQFSQSEQDRLSLDADYLRELIAQKRKAGQQTMAEEAALAQTEAALRAANLNSELMQEWDNMEAQYQLRKEYLEKELRLENLSAEQRAAIEQELAQLSSDYANMRIASFENYSSQIMDMLSAANDLASALGDREVQKAESDNEAKKKALDKRLKDGLISQESYDKQVEQLDADLDKKKAEIERKAAIRQKAMSAMQIAINTAAAIMKIWAEVPKVDFGATTLALTALAATTGALQLAAVLAEPLPQARSGGLVQGASHEHGGVLVNTEGGERIVSAAPSRAFPELLNLISWIGKHSSIPDTGYGMSSYHVPSQAGTEIDYERLSDMMASRLSSALSEMKIYTAITDVRDADRQYTIMENASRV